jgi:hypothetical protein
MRSVPYYDWDWDIRTTRSLLHMLIDDMCGYEHERTKRQVADALYDLGCEEIPAW